MSRFIPSRSYGRVMARSRPWRLVITQVLRGTKQQMRMAELISVAMIPDTCNTNIGICKANSCIYIITCQPCASKGVTAKYIVETARTKWDRIY